MASRQSVSHPATTEVLLGESACLANDIARWRQAAQPILREMVSLTLDHYPIGTYEYYDTVPFDLTSRSLVVAKALRENEYPIVWTAVHSPNAQPDYARLSLFRDRRTVPDIGPIFGLRLGNNVSSRAVPALEQYVDLILRGDLHAYYFNDLLSGYHKVRRIIRHFSDEPNTWVRKGFLTSVLLRSAREEPYQIAAQAGRDAAKYEELRSEGEEPFSAGQLYALAAKAMQGYLDWPADVRDTEAMVDRPMSSGNLVLPHQRKPGYADITIPSILP